MARVRNNQGHRNKILNVFMRPYLEQELLVKQYRTEATKTIVGKLAKKMGADKILTAFKVAEDQMKRAREDAKTFSFLKKFFFLLRVLLFKMNSPTATDLIS